METNKGKKEKLIKRGGKSHVKIKQSFGLRWGHGIR